MAIDEKLGARLAAYLDGEAGPQEAQALEKIVSEDVEARRALEQMREARRLLRHYDTTTSAELAAATRGAAPDLSGQQLDHFVVECRIGRGGMGEVYRALDTTLDRPVAIKLISPTVAATPHLADRFVREARVQAQIDHPHVAHVYHVGSYQGRLYFAMEHLPGGSLEDRLRNQERLDPEEAIDIIVEVADILDSTRRRGVVHRDLKPSNIMFTADGKIKLTDFGIAKPGTEEATELTESGALLGTPHYLSPEAAAGEEVTWRSDMYSLGCSLYRVLFGRPPYYARGPVQLAVAHIREPFPEPGQLPLGVSEELMEVLRCMMAKDPQERFPDYESLIEALNSARPRIIEPISPWKRLGVGVLDALVAGGLLVLLGLLAAGASAALGEAESAERFFPVLWAVVGVVCGGAIPAFSGNTLVQGIFAMKVRPEGLSTRSRWQLLWRGVLANPVATLGLVVFGFSLIPLGPLRSLLGAIAVLGLLGWHAADFIAALFDVRRRPLHDTLFRTRLQYVTYGD
ncbi:MAG: protein kinase domain-containing protein [Planctomycetota bacterium]|jgi:hypothetical protein